MDQRKTAAGDKMARAIRQLLETRHWCAEDRRRLERTAGAWDGQSTAPLTTFYEAQAAALREARSESGYTVEQVAAWLRVSRDEYTAKEEGCMWISLRHLWLLGELYETCGTSIMERIEELAAIDSEEWPERPEPA